MQDVSISLEFTPNPNTLKFVVSAAVLSKGALNFTAPAEAKHSELAQALFSVTGVQAVMLGTNFVTITKSPTGDWDTIADDVPKTIETYYKLGKPTVDPKWLEESQAKSSSGSESEIERKIKEVLDNEIRPAVAMDGGDILFGRFEDGVVYLHLQGACSSCPSSIATLKMGVETRLKEVIPEVKEVVQV